MDKCDERFEFKIDEDNGAYLDMHGCHHDTKAEAMYYGQLELCGCGQPEEVHKLMIDCLKCFDGEWPKPGIDAIEAIVKERSSIVAEFISHFLDQKHLTEHGGSVYGSWLAERGKQFIELGVMVESFE